MTATVICGDNFFSENAEAALADVESALSQQAAFVLAVQQRLDRTLVEAESIRELDPEMAKLLEAREADPLTPDPIRLWRRVLGRQTDERKWLAFYPPDPRRN